MRLAVNELCLIHRRRDCCGREVPKSRIGMPTGGGKTRYLSFEPGVTRIPDEHHPRHYRERRSPSAMKRLLKRKVDEQEGLCAICHQPFTDARDIVPDHIKPRGMSAARRDDHPDNIQAAHSLCNLEKGSRRL